MSSEHMSIEDLLDLIDDCTEQLERRSPEIADENENYIVETARRLQALASHFGPMLEERFPRVPDEVLAEKPFHTVVHWPDVPGAHEGSPLSMFSGGPPMTNGVLGRVFTGEVEEGPDEEEH